VIKHSLALGYFFLAAFCVFAGPQCPPIYSPIFITSAAFAFFLGLTFFVPAVTPQVQACNRFLAKWLRMAQQPPQSTANEIQTRPDSHI
jgi:hypothetical protein